MNAERLIDTLKREQAELALNTLLNPRARDAFEFGLACGVVQAYERMLTRIQDQLAEADGKPKQESRPARVVNPYLSELDNAPVLPEQMGRR